jgi:hypothetical protein
MADYIVPDSNPYFKINDINFSMYVNELNVQTENIFNSQTNAAGDTVVDFVNKKRQVEVGIIPLNDTAMKSLLTEIDKFNVSITFRNPHTNALETINAIIPSSGIEYYTIQVGKVLYKEFKLEFQEL